MNNGDDVFARIPLPIGGLILSLIGVISLLAGIFKWEWFDKGRSYKQGWISALFGQKGIWRSYRIAGIGMIVGGLFFAISSF